MFALLKMIKDNLGDTNFVYHFTKQVAVSVPKGPEKEKMGRRQDAFIESLSMEPRDGWAFEADQMHRASGHAHF